MLIMIMATNIYKVRIISWIYSRHLVDWTSLVLCTYNSITCNMAISDFITFIIHSG